MSGHDPGKPWPLDIRSAMARMYRTYNEQGKKLRASLAAIQVEAHALGVVLEPISFPADDPERAAASRALLGALTALEHDDVERALVGDGGACERARGGCSPAGRGCPDCAFESARSAQDEAPAHRGRNRSTQ